MKNLKKLLACLLALCLLAGFAQAEADLGKNRAYYEIFVGGFYDSNGDGLGDLRGVLEKLDTLTAPDGLGVQGLWLMPIFPSPSYHKYDATDYCAIDPAYGTLAEFDALLRACDEKNVAVILDLAINHTSDQHPWFASAAASIAVPPCGQAKCTVPGLCRAHNPYCDYYHFAEQNPGGWHALTGADGWFYQGVFWGGMPDLNLGSPVVRKEIQKVLAYWLNRGVAGFRLDAVTQYVDQNVADNVAVLRWLASEVYALQPNAYLVGEAWTDAEGVARYYESGLDSFFNFPSAQAEGEIVKHVRNRQGQALAQSIAAWQEKIRGYHLRAIDAPFLSNHDMARSAGFLRRDLPLEKMCAAVYLLMPGNPFIYYGEEIGMTGSGRDENKRQPMVWSAADQTGQPNPPEGCDQTQNLAAGVAEQQLDPASLWRFYQQALAIRRQFPAIGTARYIQPIAVEDGAICAWRGEGVAVLHNFGQQESRLPLANLAPNSTLAATLDAGPGGAHIDGDSLVLPPYATAILQ